MGSPRLSFRLHGLRKLNWVERTDVSYADHLASTGLDAWIDPGAFAIVVGPNAGGKSTIIDLLRGLADARLWPGLARENYPGDDFSGFDVRGASFSLSVRFSKYTPEAADVFDKLTILAVVRSSVGDYSLQILAPKYDADGPWSDAIQSMLDTKIGLIVHCLPATGRHPGEELDDVSLVEYLNEISPYFPSVLANPAVEPFKLFRGAAEGPGRIGILFKDDPGQHAFVHRKALPLGWLQLASVLAFLRQCRPGSLILLDEPDRHLHPSLQRVMLELVAGERDRLSSQMVLSTHSSALVNPELCARVGASVIIAARGRCEILTDARRVLDDLGVMSGDVVQANGIVWVEGPSDRLYLKTWLERFALDRNLSPPIERVHYAFVSYGGALLKHLTLSSSGNDKVDLRSINRNFAIVIDRDLAREVDAALEIEKVRLLSEAAALGATQQIWITEDYTIESYLPKDWSAGARFIRVDEQGRTSVRGISKVELANRFRNDDRSWTNSFTEGSDIPRRIEGLYSQILEWQTPQEVIVAQHLPPFLRNT